MENSQSWAPEPAAPRLTSAGRPSDVWTKPWARFLIPSFSDCLFAAIFVWLFATGAGGWAGLLSDGDTGWHIRTGEWILEHGTVPQVDIFSFSKSGEPWFAWEWLTDIIYAGLHRTAGLKGLLLYSAAIISLFGVVLFRHMIWKGAAPAVVLPVALLVIGASSIHYLARPHVHTLLFLPLALWMIDRDWAKPSRAIWLLVPLTAVWTNLHGGFLALIACLGLLVAGTVAESLLAWKLDGKNLDWNPARRYGLLALLCTLASIVNPYGIKLHQHVGRYLQSDWIKNNVEEFQSPNFRNEAMLQFEILLFAGLLTAFWLVSRRRITPALWILFWAHSALGSVRHVPLFMLVAAPWVAAALTEAWKTLLDPAPRKSIRAIFADLSRDCVPACRRTSIWAAVLVAVFALLNEPAVKWPRNFPADKFPIAFIDQHEKPITTGRTLTSDEWADYLTYRFYPKQKIFIDGRTDFFGKQIGDDYILIVGAHWKWASLLAKYKIDTVLAPSEWALSTVLKTDRDWKLIADEGKTLLFRRVRPYDEQSPKWKQARVPEPDSASKSAVPI